MAKIYVGTYAKYNNGSIAGAWAIERGESEPIAEKPSLEHLFALHSQLARLISVRNASTKSRHKLMDVFIAQKRREIAHEECFLTQRGADLSVFSMSNDELAEELQK